MLCFLCFYFIFSFDSPPPPQSFVLLFYYYPPRIALVIVGYIIRPFPSSPEPLYQNKVRCSAFDMEMTFHSRAKKPHFYKKGAALNPILKVRVLEVGSTVRCSHRINCRCCGVEKMPYLHPR